MLTSVGPFDVAEAACTAGCDGEGNDVRTSGRELVVQEVKEVVGTTVACFSEWVSSPAFCSVGVAGGDLWHSRRQGKVLSSISHKYDSSAP